MPPRLFVDHPLRTLGDVFALPPGAARHVQVLRLQPGDAVTLFDGHGGEWSAHIAAIDRRDVQVELLAHCERECEASVAVTLALAMPANDRMDALVEKATELGAAAIQPLLTERSVLRLAGERARKRQAHWQAIAVAACEQCGRNRVPQVHAVQGLAEWLTDLAPAVQHRARLLLGWREAAGWAQAISNIGTSLILLSGPEGGLTMDEEGAARLRGFACVTLGPRVLRADTAPLAALAAISLRSA